MNSNVSMILTKLNEIFDVFGHSLSFCHCMQRLEKQLRCESNVEFQIEFEEYHMSIVLTI